MLAPAGMHVEENVARANVFTQTTSYSANLLWLISSDLLLTRPSALLGAPSALERQAPRVLCHDQAKDFTISSRRKIYSQTQPAQGV